MKKTLTIILLAVLCMGAWSVMRADDAALLEANRFINTVDREIRQARAAGRPAAQITRLVHSRDSAIVKHHMNRYLHQPYCDDAAAIEESRAYLAIVETPMYRRYINDYQTMVFEHYRDDSRSLLNIADDDDLNQAIADGSPLRITVAQRLRSALYATRYYTKYYVTRNSADVVSIPYLDDIVNRIEVLIDDAQVSLGASNKGRYAAEQLSICKALEPDFASAPPMETFTVGGVSFTMIAVKGGTFDMGATPEQQNPDSDETVHKVTLSDYSIGQTEVTQALWRAVMGNNPSNWKGDNLPVEQVSWNDCKEFIRRLNSMTGRTFRLPTEAEWEYAARGGRKSAGYQYSGSDNIDAVAWYYGNSGNKTHPVATKSPNELGIYDMSGNVWEWCEDWKGSYSDGSVTNPTGPSTGSNRVRRGGSWDFIAGYCRVAYRSNFTPGNRIYNLGLRLAL